MYINTTKPPVHVSFKQIGDNEYSLTVNQSVLPLNRKYGHMIEAPPFSNITVICDGFLKCPTEYKNENNSLFNLTFDIQIPESALGDYVDYIVLFSKVFGILI